MLNCSNCLQGTFVTINSEEETLGRNSGIFWTMMQSAAFAGNTFAYFQVFNMPQIKLYDNHVICLLMVIVIMHFASSGTMTISVVVREQCLCLCSLQSALLASSPTFWSSQLLGQNSFSLIISRTPRRKPWPNQSSRTNISKCACS